MRHDPILACAVVLTLAIAATPGEAGAADEVGRVAVAFGNTVLSIYPDGRAQKVWFHPDGTWDGLSRRGIPLAGRWTVKGDQVCMKQSKPWVPPFISYCAVYPADPHIGVAWTAKDLSGTPIQLKIVKGIVTQAPG
jgi:hypothetical protein